MIAMEQFISTLLLIISEDKKLVDVVPERIKMFQIMESKKLMIIRIRSIKNLGMEETKFLDDYWYYMGALNHIVPQWQETRMKVVALNDKVTTFIDQEEFLMKFLKEDNSMREADLVTA